MEMDHINELSAFGLPLLLLVYVVPLSKPAISFTKPWPLFESDSLEIDSSWGEWKLDAQARGTLCYKKTRDPLSDFNIGGHLVVTGRCILHPLSSARHQVLAMCMWSRSLVPSSI